MSSLKSSITQLLLGDLAQVSQPVRQRMLATVPTTLLSLAFYSVTLLVICGMEAHVCVLQSALGFQQAGYRPVVVADAVSSRAPANREAALLRLRENGIEVATTEMVLFEWLGEAGTPEFKELSRLIK